MKGREERGLYIIYQCTVKHVLYSNDVAVCMYKNVYKVERCLVDHYTCKLHDGVLISTVILDV